jgi:hypothetical protein
MVVCFPLLEIAAPGARTRRRCRLYLYSIIAQSREAHTFPARSFAQQRPAAAPVSKAPVLNSAKYSKSGFPSSRCGARSPESLCLSLDPWIVFVGFDIGPVAANRIAGAFGPGPQRPAANLLRQRVSASAKCAFCKHTIPVVELRWRIGCECHGVEAAMFFSGLRIEAQLKSL